MDPAPAPPSPLKLLLSVIVALCLGAFIILPMLHLWGTIEDTGLLMKWFVTLGIALTLAVTVLAFWKWRNDPKATEMPDGKA